MSCDLSLLARKALPGPTTQIFADRGPNEFATHRLTRPLDSWMAETMNNIEDAAARGKWNVGSEGTVGGVDDELRASDVD